MIISIVDISFKIEDLISLRKTIISNLDNKAKI